MDPAPCLEAHAAYLGSSVESKDSHRLETEEIIVVVLSEQDFLLYLDDKIQRGLPRLSSTERPSPSPI